MSPSPENHSYVLFASAAKHAMDEALRFKRAASAAADSWSVGFYHDRWIGWRDAAWSHLAAARVAKARLGQ